MSKNTLRAYEQSLWQLESTIAGKEPTTEEIERFLKKYDGASLHRHIWAIKSYMSFTKREWPFARRHFPATNQKIPRYLNPDLVGKLYNAGQNEDDKMLVYTLFMLGCRIQELMNITTRDVTPQGVKLSIKGGKQVLTPITGKFYAILRTYAIRKNGKLFPRTYSYYYERLGIMSKAASLSRVTPHMLRHARAVDLFRKGMPLPFVQQFLHHARLDTTGIYLQIDGGELRSQLEKLDKEG